MMKLKNGAQISSDETESGMLSRYYGYYYLNQDRGHVWLHKKSAKDLDGF